MKLGIKVGPQPASIDDLAATNPAACEVWYNACKPNEYAALFDELNHRTIDVGLHFWGTVGDSIMANIAHPDPMVTDASMTLMRQTIDTAAQNSFAYVNIHPGSRSIITVDFDKLDYPSISAPVPLVEAQHLFLQRYSELTRYAQHLGVVFTVETVCPQLAKTDWYNPDSRLHPVAAYDMPVSTIADVARRGLWVANDFGHTAANMISDDPGAVWQFLLATTKTLAPQTRLIHLGFLVPPYNGTDFHDHLDNPTLETADAVPNKNQLIELLKLFATRDDVWVITEPNGQHVKNFLLAQKLLAQALA